MQNHADDLCITAQYPTFLKVEDTIEEALSELPKYYRIHRLRANPENIQVTQVLSSEQRDKEIAGNSVEWDRSGEHSSSEILGVTFDRTLSYKEHIQHTKMKVATHNNLMKNLTNSKWGTNIIIIIYIICIALYNALL